MEVLDELITTKIIILKINKLGIHVHRSILRKNLHRRGLAKRTSVPSDDQIVKSDKSEHEEELSS